MSRYLEPIEPTIHDWMAAEALEEPIVIHDWNTETMHPMVMFDRETGACLGQLMPTDRALVARSAGIQNWSKE